MHSGGSDGRPHMRRPPGLIPAADPGTGLDMSSVSADAAGGTVPTAVIRFFLGGMPVGIYMETDGVMVLSTEQVRDTEGDYHDPSAGRIKTGDYITAVDHHQIEGKPDLLEAVDRWGNEEVTLTLRRDDSVLDVQMKPAEYAPENTGWASGSAIMCRALARSHFSRRITVSVRWATGSMTSTRIS